MDAIQLLLKDHETMRSLLGRLEEASDAPTRQQLFETINSELGVHEVIEEEIFYPALKEHPKARDIVLEGYEEHHVVDMLLGEMADLSAEDETWAAKAKVMKENVEHHLEEEEGDMFEKARTVFDEGELSALGARMAERKSSAQAEHATAAE